MEPLIKSILMPVDGSETCLVAQETAATMAKKAKAKVSVLHVIPSTRSYLDLPVDMNIPTNVQEDIYANLEQRADSIVSSAEQLFKRAGVKIETDTTKEGDIADVILRKSGEGHDLLIMGGRGEDEKEQYALGSVAKKIVAHTKTPTLIVKKGSSLSKILVCVDGSRHSEKAARFAATIADIMNSEITLVNVQESLLGEKSQEVAKEVGKKVFARATKSIGAADLKVDSKVLFGVPSNRIVEAANKGNYDLIVLSKKGLGTVTRFLLGSTSDAVTYKAKCSVLLVPT